MTRARIQVNGVTGSNTDLPINTTVLLNNDGNGGEVTFAWTLLDQPAGPADVLVSATTQTPTLVPKKEGTYLLRVVVNAGLVDEATDTVVCAVRQLKSRARIPAAGETTQASTTRGWAADTNATLQTLDNATVDGGVLVAVAAGAWARGDVVALVGTATIKSGLPGAEVLPTTDLALADTEAHASRTLAFVEGGVDGAGSGLASELVRVRVHGLFTGLTSGASVGDRLYLSGSTPGAATTTAPAIRRLVGTVVAASAGVVAVAVAGVAQDTDVLHKAGAETATGMKFFSAGLKIPRDDGWPPSTGMFGVETNGSDPRPIITYAGFSTYRTLSIGGGQFPASVDSAGIYSEDSDTNDTVGFTVQGTRAFYLFSNSVDPVLSLGLWSPTFTKDSLLFRNEYTTAAGLDVLIEAYAAGDTAVDKAGGHLTLKPGPGKGVATGKDIRLHAGLSGIVSGSGDNGTVLALTINEAAVTAAVRLTAAAGLTAGGGTIKLALGSDAVGDLHYTSNADGTQSRIAAGTGWLHNNGSGTFAYSVPGYTDVGADPAGAAAAALATAGAYTVTGSAGVAGGGAISSNPTLTLDQSYSPTWSGLHTFTGTSGPNNSAIKIGVGTESTSGNTATFWGLVSAAAADGSHRGTYLQVRSGKGFSASGATAATPGGNLACAAGDGGDGSGSLAAANGRHVGLLAGSGGANGGAGGGSGGIAQMIGGSGTGLSSGGDSVIDGGASASGTAGRVLIGTNAGTNFGFGPTAGTSAVAIGVAGTTTVAINGRLTATLDANANNAIDLGSSTRQFRTLYAATSLLSPLHDVAAAGTLGIGTTTATAITLGRSAAPVTVPGAATFNSTVDIGTGTGTISAAYTPVNSTNGDLALSVGGNRVANFSVNTTGLVASLTLGRGTSNAACVASVHGFGNFFEYYDTFAYLLAGTAGAVGSGAGTLSAKAWSDGSWRFGSTNASPGLGYGGVQIDGALVANGAVTLGDATGDDITVTGRVAATIDTKTNNSFDLGSSARAWRTLYAATSVLTPLVDVISAGTLGIGTGTATALSIGKTGTTATVNAALTVSEATTLNGDVTLGNATADTITVLGIPILPKLTTTARDALTPVEAMFIYNSTTKKLNFYDTSTWREVTSV